VPGTTTTRENKKPKQPRLDTKELERQLVAGVADLIVNAVTAERLAEVSRVLSEKRALDAGPQQTSRGAGCVERARRASQSSRKFTEHGLRSCPADEN
jgi:hypothetical protein